MSLSAEARTRLASQQAALVATLAARGEMPAGFDASRLRAAATSLARKRAQAVARAWPSLTHGLGAHFHERFSTFAAAAALPREGGPLADGRAFARWLAARDELPEVGRIETMAVDLHYAARSHGRSIELKVRERGDKAPREMKFLASITSCLFVSLCMAPGAASQAPPTEYAQEFRQPFKGPPEIPEGFAVIGSETETCVKFEPEGLRITLPAGFPKERPGTGLVTRFGVQGNFEITLAYEILHEPEPNDTTPQSRFTLGVHLDRANPLQYRASVNQRWKGAGPQFQTWMARGPSPKNQEQSQMFPAHAKTGQLRLARTGEDLSYFVAEGEGADADADFKLLQKHPFGAENLKYINIAAVTGGPKAMLDMRVTDFRIRADAIPGAPVSVVASNPQNAAAPSREGGYGWLVAIGLLVALGMGAVLTLGFFLRKRAR